MWNHGTLKWRAGLAVTLICLSGSAVAQLKGLIDQNVRNAAASYQLLSEEPQVGAAEIWIHVRNRMQIDLVARHSAWFKGIRLLGDAPTVHPIELVTYGPDESQLRFFKKQDRDRAVLLLAELKKGLPRIQLQDMSDQYNNVQ